MPVVYLVLKGAYSITAQRQTFTCRAGDMLYIHDTGNAPIEHAEKGTKLFAFTVNTELCSYYGIDLAGMASHKLSGNVTLPVRMLYRHFIMNSARMHIEVDGTYRLALAALASELYNPTGKRARHIFSELATDMLLKGTPPEELRDALARETGMHKNSVSRSFSRSNGISMKSKHHRQKLDRAAHLLTTTGSKISQISDECSFTDPASFSNAFKKYAGCSPRAYRLKP